jgi:CheY-like chemotaxis protein/anti-sigma regulatory factor (Ser/Thr protein kinase)
MTRILVVDDSPLDRHLASSLLQKHGGWTTATAADGRQALQALAAETPDLVLTDLQMPEINGLELVSAVRSRYPLVPVVLMTAQGSEDIAVQALQKGAANYVPKRSLANDLVETVETVLMAAAAKRGHQRLLECLQRTESHFLLDNDPTLIPPLVGHIRENLVRMRLCDDTELVRVTVAVREALTNAIYHGNLEVTATLRAEGRAAAQRLGEERRRQETYRSRRVHVLARETPAEAQYIIRDEGPGFDPFSLPSATDPANLDRSVGRGLVLMRSFMDLVYHNSRGNEVTLIKRRRCDNPSAQ